MGARFLSARGQALPSDTAPELALAAERWDGHGAFVLQTIAGSPAELSGLRPGDVVVKFGGIWIDAFPTLLRVVSRSELDQEFELHYVRAGRVGRAWLRTMERPADQRIVEPRRVIRVPAPGR
jgi:S1-C subfamily serine protease